MEWLSAIRTVVDYLEKHLTDDISAQDVAGQVFLSPFFLQRGFSLMTGYGIGEYLRHRRLYQAALDLQRTESARLTRAAATASRASTSATTS